LQKLLFGEEKKVLTEIHHSSQNPAQSQIQKIVQGKDHYLFFEFLFLTEFGKVRRHETLISISSSSDHFSLFRQPLSDLDPGFSDQFHGQ
jgi:hypothetical protein